MPRRINGKQYYTTREACKYIGISRSTLYRYCKEDSSHDAKYRDRNGWRLWSEDEVEILNNEFNTLFVGDLQ